MERDAGDGRQGPHRPSACSDRGNHAPVHRGGDPTVRAPRAPDPQQQDRASALAGDSEPAPACEGETGGARACGRPARVRRSSRSSVGRDRLADLGAHGRDEPARRRALRATPRTRFRLPREPGLGRGDASSDRLPGGVPRRAWSRGELRGAGPPDHVRRARRHEQTEASRRRLPGARERSRPGCTDPTRGERTRGRRRHRGRRVSGTRPTRHPE